MALTDENGRTDFAGPIPTMDICFSYLQLASVKLRPGTGFHPLLAHANTAKTAITETGDLE